LVKPSKSTSGIRRGNGVGRTCGGGGEQLWKGVSSHSKLKRVWVGRKKCDRFREATEKGAGQDQKKR